ncbi:MAG: GTP cyclohydrolase I FolE2 [Candidatus Fermentibacteraceae bacterium]|nr:GTP cyclohydrolase I FolE2 [Candidatus Fermentibacteraceae bacterium]
MKDVQNTPDTRNIALKEAGIKNLSYPITILDREDREQRTVADIQMSVSLPHHFKGTHMSRFLEVLTSSGCRFTGSTIPTVLNKLKQTLQAESARIRIEFPYFLTKKAPVSRSEAKMSYNCVFTGESTASTHDFVLTVTVPVSTLCPCSKEISESGAHNQRGYITMDVRTRQLPDGSFAMIWIEELVEIAEASASSPLYTILKRPDEKFVTEQAYNNPVFVEDIVRNVAEKLRADSRVTQFTVTAENHESIHNHNAYAVVEWELT